MSTEEIREIRDTLDNEFRNLEKDLIEDIRSRNSVSLPTAVKWASVSIAFIVQLVIVVMYIHGIRSDLDHHIGIPYHDGMKETREELTKLKTQNEFILRSLSKIETEVSEIKKNVNSR